MVKVSIRDYMPPYTSWMQVELEDGVCNASPAIKNPEDGKFAKIDAQNGNKDFTFELPDTQKDNWD